MHHKAQTRGPAPAASQDDRAAAQDSALCELLRALKARGYAFITPSPRTHARVVARPYDAEANPLRDLFGWSRAVPRGALDAEIVALLEAAGGAADAAPGAMASHYRVSSEGPRLYLHSAFPTTARDAVFFGPDSYRFAAWLRRRLRDGGDVHSLAEIGAGTGVGAFTAASLFQQAKVLLTDINPAALRLARINAEAAGVTAEIRHASVMEGIGQSFDLIVANPPYLVDSGRRAYRHGGGLHGAQVALDWARAALPRLRPGGRFLLYSGAPVVRGADILRAGLHDIAAEAGARMDYAEIDPDVWGEELDSPAYAHVERIAVIGAELSVP